MGPGKTGKKRGEKDSALTAPPKNIRGPGKPLRKEGGRVSRDCMEE
jgi:hypothetical protein